MAKQDNSIKSFSGGGNISVKRFKGMLARAKTPEERAAIKSLVLSEPLKVFAKNTDGATNPIDAALAASED